MKGSPTDVLARNNVHLSGSPSARPMMFAHGFGCDSGMWRLVAPGFAADHRVVLFDHVGAGGSDRSAYSASRYDSLSAYAEDIVEILTALDYRDVVFVGHSVAAMMGVLAAAAAPDRIGALVLVGPSPRYLNDPDDPDDADDPGGAGGAAGYRGGFRRADIDGLLESLDENYLGWSSTMAPVIMGNPERPELGSELTNSFCRTEPDIARAFARVTFLSDNRADLARVAVPSLVLQCREDAIAPPEVGRYVAAHLPDSRFVLLDATGHCPNLSAPEATTAAIRDFLAALATR